MSRAVLCLLCSLLCACATTRGGADGSEEDTLESFLDSAPPGLVCGETRLVGATAFSATCLPVDGAPRLSVTGLEALPEPLRDCVLTRLPLETGHVAPAACLQGAAQVLQGRLHQLGWLEATVSPPTNRPGLSEAELTVQLGGRYRVGPLQVEQSEDGRVEPHRILTKARAAAPEGSWYTSSVLAAMHSRVFQMRKFRAVWVIGGVPDPERKVVPVTIDVWEKPSREPGRPKLSKHRGSKRAEHCPRRGTICLNGRDCTYDHRLGCTVCTCRPGRW
ncbi:MAG: hypothetical protein JXB05_25500 [Myxococcaceae bacterium]|nr:hypothetical protein [Myxococcaceae bacterium]